MKQIIFQLIQTIKKYIMDEASQQVATSRHNVDPLTNQKGLYKGKGNK